VFAPAVVDFCITATEPAPPIRPKTTSLRRAPKTMTQKPDPLYTSASLLTAMYASAVSPPSKCKHSPEESTTPIQDIGWLFTNLFLLDSSRISQESSPAASTHHG
jgi:hypothetical protein